MISMRFSFSVNEDACIQLTSKASLAIFTCGIEALQSGVYRLQQALQSLCIIYYTLKLV